MWGFKYTIVPCQKQKKFSDLCTLLSGASIKKQWILSHCHIELYTRTHTHIRKHPISMVKIKPRIKIVDIGLFCVELCQMNRELIKKNEGGRERERVQFNGANKCFCMINATRRRVILIWQLSLIQFDKVSWYSNIKIMFLSYALMR